MPINREFVHFSAKPLGKVESAEQTEEFLFKPNGIWISPPDGEDGWKAWCEAERFNLDALAVATVVPFNDERVLWIRTVEELDAFHERYAVELHGMDCIDWVAVAKEYPGIVISPYQWERRLGQRVTWYYAWDCASGCIWDASIIEQ